MEPYQGFLFQRHNSRGKKGSCLMTEAMIRTCPKCGNRSVGGLLLLWSSTVQVDRNDIDPYQRYNIRGKSLIFLNVFDIFSPFESSFADPDLHESASF
jgi:hypothetical protein